MGVREGLKLMRHRTPQALSLVHPGLLTADIVFVKTGQINSQNGLSVWWGVSAIISSMGVTAD